ncbi:MAG: hypothetical protein FWG79_07480 [Bacteroidales bacterium]|nr:hypothetical protein [Bacteroidales bacterium]
MKKIILTCALLSLLGSARAESFKIGQNLASFGVGFGWTHKVQLSKTTHFPSPNVMVERGILPFQNFGFLSVGGQFGFHHSNHKDQSWTSVYFIPRVALYFHEWFIEEADDFPNNIDLYVGAGVGFNFLSHHTNEIPDDTKFRLGYNFFVGGRYYFKPNASVFAEIGYGISFLNAGFTIRF